jgi:hypothetical protein
MVRASAHVTDALAASSCRSPATAVAPSRHGLKRPSGRTRQRVTPSIIM